MNETSTFTIPNRVEPLTVKCANVIREMDKEYVRDIADLVSTFPAPIPGILAKRFKHFTGLGRFEGLSRAPCKEINCNWFSYENTVNHLGKVDNCGIIYDKKSQQFFFHGYCHAVWHCGIVFSIWIDIIRDDLGISSVYAENAKGHFVNESDLKEEMIFDFLMLRAPKCSNHPNSDPEDVKNQWRPVQVAITPQEDGMVNFRIECEEKLSFWWEFTLNVKDLKALVVLSN